MSEPLFERIALVGLGLIGGSIGHAVKRGNLAKHIRLGGPRKRIKVSKPPHQHQ